MGQPMHAGTPSLPLDHVRQTLEEDEWEYEYDDDETEDYYFTLDLTTHVPNALATSAKRATHETPNKNGSIRSTSVGEPGVAPEASPNEPADQTGHQLQITDLHSDSPLVRLDNGIYNCYWSTDLGTQFHISDAAAVSNPRRPGTVLDVVGISQTRLLGKPAKLVPRPGRGRLATLADSTINTEDPSNREESDVSKRTSAQPIVADAEYGEPLTIDRASCRDPAAVAQASFLERLSRIKLKKGEKDQVPVISVRNFEQPANAGELRKVALAKDAERAKRRAEAEAEDKSQERSRIKRHRLTNIERAAEWQAAERRMAPQVSSAPTMLPRPLENVSDVIPGPHPQTGDEGRTHHEGHVVGSGHIDFNTPQPLQISSPQVVAFSQHPYVEIEALDPSLSAKDDPASRQQPGIQQNGAATASAEVLQPATQQSDEPLIEEDALPRGGDNGRRTPVEGS